VTKKTGARSGGQASSALALLRRESSRL